MNRVLILALAVSFAGCASTGSTPCSLTTCGGCCEGDVCKAGSEAAACGKGGQLCVSCPGAQTCKAGSCGSVSACNASNCSGCCTASGTCEPGTTHDACGTGAVTCSACTSSQSCATGQCKTACNAATCSGCCDASGNCFPGTAIQACGSSGNACLACGATLSCVFGACASDSDLSCGVTQNTTFTKVYTDVFPSCNVTCHRTTSVDGSNSYGLYDTQSNAYLQVGKKSLYAGTEVTLKVVDPNHPENSTLWLKVIGHPKSPSGKNIGAPMPNGSAQISAALKQTLKDWICSGAPQ